MATKVASVRLGLDASGFKREMTSVVGTAKTAGSRIGGAIRSGLAEGGRGGIDALKNAAGSARSALSSLAGVVGTVSLGALAQGSMQAEAQFRKFAFGVKRGTGEIIDWRDAMARAQQVSDKLKKSVSATDVGTAMQTLFDASGNKDFASQVAEDVAVASLSSGEEMQKLSGIAGELNEKFGVSADGMKEALNGVLSLSKTGGVEFEELAGYVGELGASAKGAGIQGVEGFQRFLGVVNAVRDNVGSMKKATSGVRGLVEGLESGETAKKAKVAVGVDVAAMQKAGASFDKIIATIVTKAKGDTKKLADIFGGGAQLQAVQAIGSLGSSVAEIEASLTEASKASTTWADHVNEAAKNAESGPGRLNAAMEEMRRAFQKPEIADAITSLAQHLPQLAKLVADAVGFAAENPLTAGAAVGGGIFLKGAAEAALPSILMRAFAGGGTTAAAAIEGGIAKGGSRFAVGLPVAIAAGAALTAAALLEAGQDASERDAKAREEAALKNERADISERGGGGETGAGAASDTMGYLDGAVATADQIRAAGDSVDVQRARQEALDRGENPWAVEGVGEEVEMDFDPRTGQAGPMLPKAIREKGYEWEAAKLASDEDADWEDYAKANGIDEASLAKPAAAAPKSPQQQGGFDAAQARLLAEMLGGKELRVRIMNPQDIAGSASGAPAPRPGHVPR